MAGIDRVSLGGTTYELVPEIAPLFDNTKKYVVGDCVIKDAKLYKFTTTHAAGAWIGTDAEEVTVGKELTDLKADLDDISEVSSNLFDPNAINIGVDALGNSTPTRTITDNIYVGTNGAYIQAINLPSNIKYDVEYYDSATKSRGSLKGSSSYISNTSVYHYKQSYPYIAILFAGTDGRVLTKADFVGLEMRVSLSADDTYEPHLTAKDRVARQSIETANSYIASTNLVSDSVDVTSVWEEGSIAKSTGDNLYEQGRLRTSSYLPTNVGNIKTNGNIGLFVLAYDSNDEFSYVGAYASGDLFVTDGTENGVVNISLARLLVKNPSYRFKLVAYSRTSSDLTLSDVQYITFANSNTKPAHVKVIQYNIGKFNMGQSGGLSTNVETKIANYKNFFADTNAEIICLQEYTEHIDSENEYSSNETLFNPIYKFDSWEEKEVAIKSQFELFNSRFSYLHTSGDYPSWCIYGDTIINCKAFAVVSGVMSVEADTTQKIRALTKLTELLLNVYDNAIICMDTNALSKTEADAIKTFMTGKGYTSGNWNYLGYKDTYNLSSSMYKAIDNIFIKGNAKIVNFQVPDVYADLSSDHFPVIADIVVY